MVKTDKETITTLLERGTVDVVVKESLQKRLTSGKKLRVKLGIDPTGADLHIGHAVPLRKLKQFQDVGHQAVLVIGDYTARIGDPSGKSVTRPVLSEKQIRENMDRYIEQAGKVIDTDKLEIRYNSEWFSKISMAEILKIASSRTVAQILHRNDFKERMEKDVDISMSEIFYPLMQGYDSVVLRADVEVGGTDQLFNILMGRPIQKLYGQEQQDIITVQILEGLDGHEKMSKSLNNYIAILDPPNEMYGKTMSIPDELIIKYFELATDITSNEIAKIKKTMDEGENPRNLKMRLGRELVTLYHGAKQAKDAEEHFVTMFQKKDIPQDIEEIAMKKKEWPLVDLIADLKLSPSKSETRRMMQGGGVKIDGEKITDISASVTLKKDPITLQVGKRNMVRVKIG